jgi:cyclase
MQIYFKASDRKNRSLKKLPLAKRIIPCLDVDHGKVVKCINFLNPKQAGDPVEMAEGYSAEGADELVFLDITASSEKRDILRGVVEGVARAINIPFTVGGGIRNVNDARLILCSGADKISVNTAAVEDSKLITELADVFGRQCVVVAIDAKRNCINKKDKTIIETSENKLWFEVVTYGGRKPTGIDAVAWAIQAEKLGAGEFLITSMDKDGTKDGYDIELTRAISERVNVPVIASGGAGNPKHLLDVFTEGKADAALAASIFHYNNYPVPVVKKYLRRMGVTIRP